ncbi:RNA polymerase sigma factor [Bacillus solimangrovi]|uniref:RNA polymerase subunit sigma-70 n=1 Tax=Bacillus solimangrovi TaxID=1305675 RepID=A0A1E5LI98_9BACI|nr:RNA polymerase sigma factor [Bacillus solimangrovi]OEH93776.1 hypothetical protein BFG57_11375 [Bacillus solimangrovi]
MDQNRFNQLKKRDEDAFLEMMHLYRNTVYFTALTYMKNEQEALEAVQEVTFRAFKNYHKIKKSSAIKAWLTKITINYCLDELKKRTNIHHDDTYMQELSKEQNDWFTSIFISEAIQTLKPKYQVVLILKYQQDMTNVQIAESLSMPIGTVKTYLNRSLKDLKAYMKKGGIEHYEAERLFK